MRDSLLNSRIIHCDETRVQVLKEPDREAHWLARSIEDVHAGHAAKNLNPGESATTILPAWAFDQVDSPKTMRAPSLRRDHL